MEPGPRGTVLWLGTVTFLVTNQLFIPEFDMDRIRPWIGVDWVV